MARCALTVAEYPWMREAGILTGRDCVELIEEQLVAANEVEVCRVPNGDDYVSVSRVGHDGVLEPELLAGVMLPAATIFGDDREGALP